MYIETPNILITQKAFMWSNNERIEWGIILLGHVLVFGYVVKKGLQLNIIHNVLLR